MLSQNQREFLEHLQLPAAAPGLAMELIQTEWVPDEADWYQAETYRLFHNYLAAVSSLVEHSRNLVKAYPQQTDLQSEYQARVDHIRNDPVAKFVQELRNFYVHERLPDFITTVRFHTEEDGTTTFEHILQLQREDLFNSQRGWTAPAQVFLDAQDDAFPVLDVVVQYADSVESLSSWLGHQYEVLHREDIDDYNDAVDSFNRALGLKTGPLPTWEGHLAKAARQAEERRIDSQAESS
jgi:hypothetical protein